MSFVTRKTTDQMAEESKKATEEGMRLIAEGLKKKAQVMVQEEECFAPDSDDSTSIESVMEYKPKAKKRARPAIESNGQLEKLETRIHYMQLDLANTKVDLSDKSNELDVAKRRLESVKKVEDCLALLCGLGFYLNDIKGLTLAQLKRKQTLYLEEEMEHAINCMKAVGCIENWPFVKDALIATIEKQRQKNKRIELTLELAIAKRNFWDKFEKAMFQVVGVILFFLFAYLALMAIL